MIGMFSLFTSPSSTFTSCQIERPDLRRLTEANDFEIEPKNLLNVPKYNASKFECLWLLCRARDEHGESHVSAVPR
jgi:hypothetical protein